MKRNTGTVDRVIRGIVGIVLGAFGIMNISVWWGIVLLIVGVVFLFTAFSGWCPIYHILKISTYKKS